MGIRDQSVFDLSGHRALVIGAGSGIGAATAQLLAGQGAEVHCADLDEGAAAAVAAAVVSSGGVATSSHVDITDTDGLEALARDQGDLDSLVVTPAINVRKRLLDISDDEFERVVDLNLTSVFRACRAFGRRMAAAGNGSIITLSSIRSQTVEPGQGAYAATKAAVVQLTRALATELGPSGVRVNAVAPGVIETPLTEGIKADPDWYQAYSDKTVLQRWGRASEVAAAICFLAAPASSYITGTVLFVDGGWLAADGRFDPPL